MLKTYDFLLVFIIQNCLINGTQLLSLSAIYSFTAIAVARAVYLKFEHDFIYSSNMYHSHPMHCI